MAKVELEIDGKIARIYLNRPKVLNAIDTELPSLLSSAVKKAADNEGVHVIILSGKGDGFCAGYDLAAFAEEKDNPLTQKMPWDPIKDYRFMWENN
jgi:enoyl-CoA hydratase